MRSDNDRYVAEATRLELVNIVYKLKLTMVGRRREAI